MIRDSRILWKHARKQPNGKPVRCTPSDREIRVGGIARKELAGTDHKLIFDTRDIARMAAYDIEIATGYLLTEYQCRRSKSGHYHLTTDNSAMRRKARKAKTS